MLTQTLSRVLRKPLGLYLTHRLRGAPPPFITGRVSKLAIPGWSQNYEGYGVRFNSTNSQETPASAPTPTATPAPEEKKKKKKKKKKSAAKETSSASQEEEPSSNQEEQKKQPRPLSPEELKAYLETFFSQYTGFVYDPTEPYMDEFYRMTNQFSWNFRSDEFREAWQNLNKDDMLQFNPSPDHQKNSETNSESKKKKKRLPAFIPGPRTQDELRAHFIAYFAKYPLFDYNSSKPYLEEFDRMCSGWDKKSPEYVEARKAFRKATIKQLCDIYGLDPEDLKVWRNLVCTLGVKDVQDTRKGYAKWVRKQYINICDLVDHPVTNVAVELFETEDKLSKYSLNRNIEKIFPLCDKGLLHHLLRLILAPRKTKNRRVDEYIES